MKIQNWTPQSLAAELRKNIIGQDNYLDDLCLSVWLHSLRIQAGNATGRRIRQPKMNLLVLGPSGSGKTSAVQKLAELLGRQGIQIARRTVAKYRTELRLGSAAARRRE